MEKNLEREGIAGEDQQGRRLDAALAVLFPSLGLRGRRRLWKEHLALVDGIARSPAFRLRGGETIRLVPLCSANAAQDVAAAFAADPPRFLARRGNLFFFCKPGGLHTESLAGASAGSLAGMLGRLTPEGIGTRLRLLGRLDQGSSGIVPAAGDEETARRWRQWENAGDMEKSYLAVLEGRLEGEELVRNALDLAKKRRTRVLGEEGPALRHTRIRPLASFQAGDAPQLPAGCPDGAYTLALCCIAKGARHQIRAHAAHIGYPLAGDALYGACGASVFFLHHCRIEWPEGQLFCPPPWSLPASLISIPECNRPLHPSSG